MACPVAMHSCQPNQSISIGSHSGGPLGTVAYHSLLGTQYSSHSMHSHSRGPLGTHSYRSLLGFACSCVVGRSLLRCPVLVGSCYLVVSASFHVVHVDLDYHGLLIFSHAASLSIRLDCMDYPFICSSGPRGIWRHTAIVLLHGNIACSGLLLSFVQRSQWYPPHRNSFTWLLVLSVRLHGLLLISPHVVPVAHCNYHGLFVHLFQVVCCPLDWTPTDSCSIIADSPFTWSHHADRINYHGLLIQPINTTGLELSGACALLIILLVVPPTGPCSNRQSC
jgi:hypothetical protein